MDAKLDDMTPILPADASPQLAQRYYSQADRFAAFALSPVIEDVRKGYARVSMDIEEHHRNPMGQLMGGASAAFFDYVFAIASNIGLPPTVTVSSTIEYVGKAHTNHLVGEGVVEKDGAALCFVTVVVRDSAGNQVVRGTVTGMHVAWPLSARPSLTA